MSNAVVATEGTDRVSVAIRRLIRTYPPLPRYAAPSAVLCRSV